MKRYLQFKKALTIAFAIAAISLVGCEQYVIESTVIDPNEPRSFQTDILPIFANHGCAASSCHGGTFLPDLRPDKAYASLKSTNCVTGTPATSAKLYKKFNNPHSGITLLDSDKQYILYWIEQGALDN